MKKNILLVVFAILSGLSLSAQTLEKMNWFNEPDHWQINGGTLTMDVTPNSDYWRISHYGFTVDDAPFSIMPNMAASLRPRLKSRAIIRSGSTRPE